MRTGLTKLQRGSLHYHHFQILKYLAFGGGDPLEEIDLEKESPDLLTWRSGIEAVDERGGFYNCTAVAGNKKLGKSMVALKSAVLAAEDGWQTFIFDWELNRRLMGQRACNIRRQPWSRWPRDLRERIHTHRLTPKSNIEEVADFVGNRLDEQYDRRLIVLDSINYMAKHTDNYFKGLEKICDWAATCSRMSDGRIAFILVSMVNRAGQAEGKHIEFSSDVILTLKTTGKDDVVNLELDSRETRGGNLGDHTRIYSTCSFSKPGLRVVPRSDVDDGPNDDAGEEMPPETGSLPW